MFAGGRIDHAHHFINPFRALEETLVLESTLLAILSVVNLQETLIVLTSDHSHVLTLGGLTTPKGNNILGEYRACEKYREEAILIKCGIIVKVRGRQTRLLVDMTSFGPCQ